jgi:ferredoxin-type protein NapH
VTRRGIRLAVTLAAIALVVYVGALVVDLPFVSSTNTYGNFDLPGQPGFVTFLLPGVRDSAGAKVYGFGHGVHLAPIFALLVVFAVFLAIRAWRSTDLRLGIASWLTSWAAFVVSRLGLLRVSGAYPVERCSFGVFPFLNCQACEMATGACPIGSLQASLVRLRFPLLPLVVLGIAGLSLGRWICGWLCPFGLLSDMFQRGSRKVWRPAKAWAALKFVILGLIFVVPLAMGLAGGADWLPFCSTFCVSGDFYGLLPFYATTGARDFGAAFAGGNAVALVTILFHASVLLGFVWLAIQVSGRVFCRYVCPLGAFLGLFYKISFVRVEHVDSSCIQCGECEDACAMGIHLREDDFLTRSNCISCGRCLKLCPTGARRWAFGWGGRSAEPKERESAGTRLVLPTRL